MRQNSSRANSKLDAGFPYDEETGRWWLERSTDAAHRRAYKNIAAFIQNSFVRLPKVIVDYACGAGNLIFLLSCCFPFSKLVGLDGSSLLLGSAMRRFSRLPRSRAGPISLIETALPSIDLLRAQADLVVFCFPNMVHSSAGPEMKSWTTCLSKDDREIAESLAQGEDAHVLMQSRCISLNLRQLLLWGGICVRVEYATMQRHELSRPELLQVSFEEGSLDFPVQGRKPRQWFRVLASAYFRSQVLEDVYQQTGDDRDRNGGYLITVLRAI